MANRIIEAILRISAKMGSTAALDGLADKMARVDKKAKAYNRSVGMTRTAVGNATAVMARWGSVASAAGAVAAVSATKDYAALERRLTRIGINAEAGREQMEKVRGDLHRIAADVHAPVENVVDGLESLIAAGKTLDEAMAILPSVAGTANAADAAFGDMATTADAVSESFGIAAGRMQNAFDILAYGGKAGKFELKDMASELPSLAPAFAALGYEGEKGLMKLVAAAQTVRKEVGTSGEAATSLMDVFSKMQSETVANNFKKFGVDIRAEMTKAKETGEDTLEAFIRLSREAVGGDMEKLPRLFTDKQMLIGMRALMNRTDEYRDLLLSLGDAAGTVQGDLRRLADDAQDSFTRMGNSWDRFKEGFGKLAAPAVSAGMDAVSGVMDDEAAILSARHKGETAGVDWSAIRAKVSAKNRGLTAPFKTGAEMRDIMAGYGRGEIADIRAYEVLGRSARRPVTPTPAAATDAHEVAAHRDHAISRLAAPPMIDMANGFNAFAGFEARITSPAESAASILARGGEQAGEAIKAGAHSASAEMSGPSSPSQRDAERYSMAAMRSDPNGLADAIDEALSRAGRNARIELPPMPSPPPAPDSGSLRPGQSVPDLDALLSNLEAAADQSGDALAQGGSAAGQSVEAGGRSAADALLGAGPAAGQSLGDAATSRIHAGAAAAGAAFGEAAAARLRAEFSALTRSLGAIRAQPAAPAASGSPGRTSASAGGAMPQ